MKFLWLVFSGLIISGCGSKPVKIKTAAQELYKNGSESICPDISDNSTARKEAAYCLGWIYVQETNKRLPSIDQLGFQDLKAGDPTIPYVWVVVSTGIMKPDTHQEFGLDRSITKDEWEDALGRMQVLVKSWEKKAPSLRLK